MSSPTLKQLFDEQGYVVVPDLIPADMLDALEAACADVIKKTRTGEWPHRRTLGRQFPPYGDGDPDSWGVQHVMHPDLGHPVFARWYTSDALVDVVKELLGCDDQLQMGEWSPRAFGDLDATSLQCRTVQHPHQSDVKLVRAPVAPRRCQANCDRDGGAGSSRGLALWRTHDRLMHALIN